MAIPTDVNASIDIGKNLTSLLERLAAQIGTTADKVFPWYVKQQVLEGWTYFALLIPFFVLGTVLCIKGFNKVDCDDENKYTVVLGVGVVLLILVFFACVANFGNAFTQILNPNYHALHAIITDMSGLAGK
jgi:hypothetical protein